MKVVCLTNVLKGRRRHPLEGHIDDKVLDLTPGKVYELTGDMDWRFITDDLGHVQYYLPTMFMEYDTWRENKINEILKDV